MFKVDFEGKFKKPWEVTNTDKPLQYDPPKQTVIQQPDEVGEAPDVGEESIKTSKDAE